MRPLARILTRISIAAAFLLSLLLVHQYIPNWGQQSQQKQSLRDTEVIHQIEESWLSSLINKLYGNSYEDRNFSPSAQGYMNYRLSLPAPKSDPYEPKWDLIESVEASNPLKGDRMGSESAINEPKGLIAPRKSQVKCARNKYDLEIEQEIGKNALSRPLKTSAGRFDNPFSTWSQASLANVVQFILEPSESNVPNNKDEIEKQLPLLKPNFDAKSRPDTEYRVTWIGHATLLIQVDGFNILTDPIFSDRASFTQYFGPKRIRQPACDINSLPRIDIVLISHNHYDHLDAGSVKQINERFGRNCRWIVPLGLGEFLQSMHVQNYVELDWWQKDCFAFRPASINLKTSTNDNFKLELSPIAILSNKVISDDRTSQQSETAYKDINYSETTAEQSELDIYLTPSQHWSRRGIADTNKSLWGSYTIVSKSGSTFFFAGDSGYCTAFKEIGKIFGPFTGAAIPIGAYKPRWFLKAQHVDPAEAVQVHKDLRCKKSIAIHHSTFILSNEDYREPPKLLSEIMQEHKANGSLTNEPFLALKHGESADFCKAC